MPLHFSTLLSCLLLLCAPLFAQQEMAFSQFGSKDGLSDNRIREIVQLPDGRMIVCTIGTTNIFDGTTFRQLHENAGHVSALSGYSQYNKGYAVANYLWIKTRYQVRLIDVALETFVPKPDQVLRSIGNGEPVVNFFVDENRQYWLVTSTDKLIFSNPERAEKRVFRQHISLVNGEKDQLLQVVVHGSEVFLFYQSGVMICCDLTSGKERYQNRYLNAAEKNQANRGIKAVQTPRNLYVLTLGNEGLFKAFDVQSRRWNTVLKTPYELRNLAFDNRQTVWIYGKNGLWKLNVNDQSKSFVSSFRLVDGRFIQTEAFALCNDNQGGLWIGTLNHGLLYYHPDRFKFQKYDKAFVQSGMELDVTCFADISSRETAIGTSRGLFVFNHDSHQISRYKVVPEQLACTKMFHDQSGKLWLATANGTYYTLKPKFQKVTTNPSFFLRQLTKTSKKFFSAAVLRDSIHQLIPYSDSMLLGFSHSGIFFLNTRHPKITYPKNAFLSNNVKPLTCGTIDKQGLVWIGTLDGLLLWNPKTNVTKAIYTDNGLINNSIKGILEDRNGDIWVTTAGGLCRIQTRHSENDIHLEFSNFNEFDGTINTEFVNRSVHQSGNGLLFFGGINGFNTFDLNTPWKVKKLNAPIFTQLNISGKPVKTGEAIQGKTVLNRALTSTDTIRLSYKQNDISIDVASLNYINPSQTYFRYRLEENNDAWTEMHAPNGTGRIGFTNLAPGYYTLTVYAANNSSEWSAQPAKIIIHIAPPFWKTNLAYLCYFLMLSLLVFFSIKRYQRVTKKRLETQNEAKLNQLKFDFFTNISHELRTPLTLIITPLESLIQEIQEAKLQQKIQGIWRNAKELLSLVNQLIDFRRSEVVGDPLRLSYGNLSEFIDQIKVLFDNLAAYKQIDFSVKGVDGDLFMYFDKDKLFSIVNNLLSNAFKFTPVGGRISLMLKQEQYDITIEVTDSGIGIPAEDLSKIFNRFYQAESNQKGSGIGLHLVQQYVGLHGGSISVESRPNEQTTFTVRLPKNLYQASEKDKMVIEPVSAMDEASTPAPTPLHKVLIVEDNDELRYFIATEFSKYYRILEASNGVEGEEITLSEMPDIVISDVMMPLMDGHELCKRLKSNVQTSHIPIILLTARSSDEHKLEGYESGADEYMTKPFRLELLLLRTNQLIEKQTRLKELFRKPIDIKPSDIQIGTLDEQLIQQAMECVERNMSNAEYSVAEMSRDMHMDRTVLYRKLQSITGFTPIEFIRMMRLKRAAQILNQGQYPISEVASMVGFNTQKYFTKYFKEAFGVTPSQYKNNEPL